MNSDHLQQIFANYIDQFERLNGKKHQEYYKWQIIRRFHDEMDAALSASDDELTARLIEMKKLASNLIDSYTQPFQGLAKFAEKEPETVRKMFRDLYRDDGGDLSDRQNRIQEFLKKSHALRDKYYKESYLYKDDMHSVTGYLFLYDPDHNYMFKATHAQAFADCVEFYDDWGSGDTVNLKTYYRMCDWIVEEAKASKELMATDASRFENGWGVDPTTFYKDPEKHILAFDLIYCCSTYGLFKGITFVRPKIKERALMQERKEKAQQLFKKLEDSRRKCEELEKAKEYVNSVYTPGTSIYHISHGSGIISENNGTRITVDFPEAGRKLLGIFKSAANGVITVDADDYADKMNVYKELLLKEDSIKSNLSYAEWEFAPYAEYL